MKTDELLGTMKDEQLILGLHGLLNLKALLILATGLVWIVLTVWHLVSPPDSALFGAALFAVPFLLIYFMLSFVSTGRRIEFLQLRLRVGAIEKLAGVKYVTVNPESVPVQQVLLYRGEVFDDERLDSHMKELENGG